MSRLRISAEQSDTLVGACRARVHLVDHADGFVELQVWRTTGSRPSSISSSSICTPMRSLRNEPDRAAERLAADRYFDRFPEALERYGDAGRAWELHDTQHLLHWAIADVEGFVDMQHHVGWLAGVLQARDFPLEHLAANLELAADVVEERLQAEAVAERLRDAALSVRAR
jgi:hypothetical protein